MVEQLEEAEKRKLQLWEGDSMNKMLLSRKGMTLVEIIMALAVFGIVSVPIVTLFMNSSLTLKATQKQMEINAASRQAKEAVVDWVKSESSVPTTTSGTINAKYEYDAELTTQAAITTNAIGVNFPNTYQYKIIIKSSGSSESAVNVFSVLINKE